MFDPMLSRAPLLDFQFKSMAQRPEIEKNTDLGDKGGFANGFLDIIYRSGEVCLFDLGIILICGDKNYRQ